MSKYVLTELAKAISLSWSPMGRRLAYAYALHQEEVLQVCAVYPSKVSLQDMDTALTSLGLSPKGVYMHLSEGKRLPELDKTLATLRRERHITRDE